MKAKLKKYQKSNPNLYLSHQKSAYLLTIKGSLGLTPPKSVLYKKIKGNQLPHTIYIRM
jgi:hypothetical protein